jgi:hypothetical protein
MKVCVVPGRYTAGAWDVLVSECLRPVTATFSFHDAERRAREYAQLKESIAGLPLPEWFTEMLYAVPLEYYHQYANQVDTLSENGETESAAFGGRWAFDEAKFYAHWHNYPLVTKKHLAKWKATATPEAVEQHERQLAEIKAVCGVPVGGYGKRKD